MESILGLDVGTSVVKAAVFDSDLTEIAVVARRTTLKTTHPGWIEIRQAKAHNKPA